MVGVATDEGGRRLPSWMMGASTADQIIGKSDNTKAKQNQSEDSIPRTKRTRRVKEESLSESLDVVVKSETRKRKPKEKPKVADSGTDVSEHVVVLKKCNGTRTIKLSESDSRKRVKTRDSESRGEPEIQCLTEDDDDVELTVEDLMTFANEYVTEVKNMKKDQVPKSTREQSYRSTTMSSRSESTDNDGARICNELTKATVDTNISAFSESKSDSLEDIVVRSSGTGDPALDMLDLFLGPLLKKPVDEKKTNFLGKDVAFSFEVGIPNETNIVREDIAPSMTKKKSTLKDKIAMFLD